ncbi:tetratricopeptide repeat protein [Marinimicrobium sp. ARAG 43.8]|uniref:tetratricopeptide repeat protein n=1 Tax=Marinimicrobium sp. ARAG 43.8 TaxID=3418719 RepID=UPI003CF3BBEF
MLFRIHLLASVVVAYQANAAVDPTQQCAGCHAEQVNEWKGSHHYHAMGVATPDTALGNFDNQRLNYRGSEATFITRDGSLFIEMPNRAGKMQTYSVTHTFGYEPLQQYMFTEGAGKYQFFPFAWDSRPKTEGGKRWFVLFPEQQPSDPFHWSNMGQNWNQMCAKCHTTDYRKGFDLESRRYDFSFSSINVSCAVCHGSSDTHLAWAAGDQKSPDNGYERPIGTKTSLFRENQKGVMQAIASLKPSGQVEVCAGCHSRRASFSNSESPEDFYHHMQPALITEDLYHADGQIWDEVYVWGSFKQSAMHEAGVTCTNCHNPHSGQLKRSGNAVCTQCHTQETYDSEGHHGHKVDSRGSFCVDCHMPQTTYMQVDPRRDHGFKVPRPDLTQSVGTPNACNGCHEEQSPAWAEKQIRQWHPDSAYLGEPHFASAFHAADQGEPGAAQSLTKLAQDGSLPDIVQASALVRLQQTPGRNAAVAIVRAVESDDPLQRRAAITAVAPYPEPVKWRLLNELLGDNHKPIRVAAARELTPMLRQAFAEQISEQDRARLQKGVNEYREVQRYQADRGVSHVNLGMVAQLLGRMNEAKGHYENAIDIEPIFMPGYVNLADIYRIEGQEDKAQGVLKRALEINPEASIIHYAMGMSYVRQGQKSVAQQYLKAAASVKNPQADHLYAYGLFLQDSGNLEEALTVLKAAYEKAPNTVTYNHALMNLYQQQHRYQDALLHLEKMEALLPNNPQVHELKKKLLKKE